MITNVHQRTLPVPVDEAGFLIDELAGPNDRLWPYDRWPAIRFDRPLQVGAKGGHGPFRYKVGAYAPGRRVQFVFGGPYVDGFHEFELLEGDATHCVLRHTLMAHPSALFALGWSLLIGPLHDACLRDIMDRAEAATGGNHRRRPHPAAVRARRLLLRPLAG
jgi:hypothetical protein